MIRCLPGLTVLVITCIFITSCHSHTTNNLSINLTTFNDSIVHDSNSSAVATGCNFSLTPDAMKNGATILSLVEDEPEKALVTIDNKPIWLIRDTTSSYDERKREFVNHYHNTDYELTTDLIEINKSRAMGELEGLMTLKAANGKIITKHIIGACGD